MQKSCTFHNKKCSFHGGDREIWTLAPISRPTPLAGEPLHQLGYVSMSRYWVVRGVILDRTLRAQSRDWRNGWDSNPRALADKRFSRPPRYDHFDTPARERVMGIEPTYPAWKAGVLPLNYTRIFNCSQVGVTGFEPATSWSQTRRSSQAEPHPDMLFCRFVFVASPKQLRYNITLFHTCQHFFTFFWN